MATLGSLVIELKADLARLQTDMSKGVSIVERGTASMAKAASFAKTALAGIGAGLSLAAVAGAARQAIDLGDKLRDLSIATGQSVEQLSFLDFAAGQSGTSIEAISTASQRLARNLVEVGGGAGKQAADALRLLGLSAKELAQVDLITQFSRIGSALAEIENPTQRAAAGAALFGKQFAQLAPLILEGERGIGALADRFVELGGAITTEQADKFDEFNDALGKMRLASRAASVALADAFAPALTAVYSTIATTLPNVRGFFTDAFFAIEEVVLDASRAVQKSKLDFIDFFNVFGVADSSVADARKRVAEITEEIRNLRDARQGALDELVSQRQGVRASLGKAVPAPVETTDPEAELRAAAKADAARMKAERDLARERVAGLRRYDQAVDETLRQVEEEAAQWAELDRRREAFTKSVATDLEKSLARLAEANELFGPDSAEYGRAAIEAFERLNPEIEEANKATDQLRDATRELGLTFASAFEDAVVEGAKFSDVLRGIEQDLLRLGTRKLVTEPLTDYFGKVLEGVKGGSDSGGGGGITGLLEKAGGFFSSLFGGARATGGPVSPGKGYLVGEQEPEFFFPSQAGTIVPMSAMGGGSTVVNVSFAAIPRTPAEIQSATQQAARVGQQVRRALARNG